MFWGHVIFDLVWLEKKDIFTFISVHINVKERLRKHDEPGNNKKIRGTTRKIISFSELFVQGSWFLSPCVIYELFI